MTEWEQFPPARVKILKTILPAEWRLLKRQRSACSAEMSRSTIPLDVMFTCLHISNVEYSLVRKVLCEATFNVAPRSNLKIKKKLKTQNHNRLSYQVGNAGLIVSPFLPLW